MSDRHNHIPPTHTNVSGASGSNAQPGVATSQALSLGRISQWPPPALSALFSKSTLKQQSSNILANNQSASSVSLSSSLANSRQNMSNQVSSFPSSLYNLRPPVSGFSDITSAQPAYRAPSSTFTSSSLLPLNNSGVKSSTLLPASTPSHPPLPHHHLSQQHQPQTQQQQQPLPQQQQQQPIFPDSPQQQALLLQLLKSIAASGSTTSKNTPTSSSLSSSPSSSLSSSLTSSLTSVQSHTNTPLSLPLQAPSTSSSALPSSSLLSSSRAPLSSSASHTISIQTKSSSLSSVSSLPPSLSSLAPSASSSSLLSSLTHPRPTSSASSASTPAFSTGSASASSVAPHAHNVQQQQHHASQQQLQAAQQAHYQWQQQQQQQQQSHPASTSASAMEMSQKNTLAMLKAAVALLTSETAGNTVAPNDDRSSKMEQQSSIALLHQHQQQQQQRLLSQYPSTTSTTSTTHTPLLHASNTNTAAHTITQNPLFFTQTSANAATFTTTASTSPEPVSFDASAAAAAALKMATAMLSHPQHNPSGVSGSSGAGAGAYSSQQMHNTQYLQGNQYVQVNSHMNSLVHTQTQARMQAYPHMHPHTNLHTHPHPNASTIPATAAAGVSPSVGVSAASSRAARASRRNSTTSTNANMSTSAFLTTTGNIPAHGIADMAMDTTQVHAHALAQAHTHALTQSRTHTFYPHTLTSMHAHPHTHAHTHSVTVEHAYGTREAAYSGMSAYAGEDVGGDYTATDTHTHYAATVAAGESDGRPTRGRGVSVGAAARGRGRGRGRGKRGRPPTVNRAALADHDSFPENPENSEIPDSNSGMYPGSMSNYGDFPQNSAYTSQHSDSSPSNLSELPALHPLSTSSPLVSSTISLLTSMRTALQVGAPPRPLAFWEDAEAELRHICDTYTQAQTQAQSQESRHGHARGQRDLFPTVTSSPSSSAAAIASLPATLIADVIAMHARVHRLLTRAAAVLVDIRRLLDMPVPAPTPVPISLPTQAPAHTPAQTPKSAAVPSTPATSASASASAAIVTDSPSSDVAAATAAPASAPPPTFLFTRMPSSTGLATAHRAAQITYPDDLSRVPSLSPALFPPSSALSTITADTNAPRPTPKECFLFPVQHYMVVCDAVNPLRSVPEIPLPSIMSDILIDLQTRVETFSPHHIPFLEVNTLHVRISQLSKKIIFPPHFSEIALLQRLHTSGRLWADGICTALATIRYSRVSASQLTKATLTFITTLRHERTQAVDALKYLTSVYFKPPVEGDDELAQPLSSVLSSTGLSTLSSSVVAPTVANGATQVNDGVYLKAEDATTTTPSPLSSLHSPASPRTKRKQPTHPATDINTDTDTASTDATLHPTPTAGSHSVLGAKAEEDVGLGRGELGEGGVLEEKVESDGEDDAAVIGTITHDKSRRRLSTKHVDNNDNTLVHLPAPSPSLPSSLPQWSPSAALSSLTPLAALHMDIATLALQRFLEVEAIISLGWMVLQLPTVSLAILEQTVLFLRRIGLCDIDPTTERPMEPMFSLCRRLNAALYWRTQAKTLLNSGNGAPSSAYARAEDEGVHTGCTTVDDNGNVIPPRVYTGPGRKPSKSKRKGADKSSTLSSTGDDNDDVPVIHDTNADTVTYSMETTSSASSSSSSAFMSLSPASPPPFHPTTISFALSFSSRIAHKPTLSACVSLLQRMRHHPSLEHMWRCGDARAIVAEVRRRHRARREGREDEKEKEPDEAREGGKVGTHDSKDGKSHPSDEMRGELHEDILLEDEVMHAIVRYCNAASIYNTQTHTTYTSNIHAPRNTHITHTSPVHTDADVEVDMAPPYADAHDDGMANTHEHASTGAGTGGDANARVNTNPTSPPSPPCSSSSLSPAPLACLPPPLLSSLAGRDYICSAASNTSAVYLTITPDPNVPDASTTIDGIVSDTHTTDGTDKHIAALGVTAPDALAKGIPVATAASTDAQTSTAMVDANTTTTIVASAAPAEATTTLVRPDVRLAHVRSLRLLLRKRVFKSKTIENQIHAKQRRKTKSEEGEVGAHSLVSTDVDNSSRPVVNFDDEDIDAEHDGGDEWFAVSRAEISDALEDVHIRVELYQLLETLHQLTSTHVSASPSTSMSLSPSASVSAAAVALTPASSVSVSHLPNPLSPRSTCSLSSLSSLSSISSLPRGITVPRGVALLHAHTVPSLWLESDELTAHMHRSTSIQHTGHGDSNATHSTEVDGGDGGGRTETPTAIATDTTVAPGGGMDVASGGGGVGLMDRDVRDTNTDTAIPPRHTHTPTPGATTSTSVLSASHAHAAPTLSPSCSSSFFSSISSSSSSSLAPFDAITGTDALRTLFTPPTQTHVCSAEHACVTHDDTHTKANTDIASTSHTATAFTDIPLVTKEHTIPGIGKTPAPALPGSRNKKIRATESVLTPITILGTTPVSLQSLGFPLRNVEIPEIEKLMKVVDKVAYIRRELMYTLDVIAQYDQLCIQWIQTSYQNQRKSQNLDRKEKTEPLPREYTIFFANRSIKVLMGNGIDYGAKWMYFLLKNMATLPVALPEIYILDRIFWRRIWVFAARYCMRRLMVSLPSSSQLPSYSSFLSAYDAQLSSSWDDDWFSSSSSSSSCIPFRDMHDGSGHSSAYNNAGTSDRGDSDAGVADSVYLHATPSTNTYMSGAASIPANTTSAADPETTSPATQTLSSRSLANLTLSTAMETLSNEKASDVGAASNTTPTTATATATANTDATGALSVAERVSIWDIAWLLNAARVREELHRREWPAYEEQCKLSRQVQAQRELEQQQQRLRSEAAAMAMGDDDLRGVDTHAAISTSGTKEIKATTTDISTSTSASAAGSVPSVWTPTGRSALWTVLSTNRHLAHPHPSPLSASTTALLSPDALSILRVAFPAATTGIGAVGLPADTMQAWLVVVRRACRRVGEVLAGAMGADVGVVLGADVCVARAEAEVDSGAEVDNAKECRSGQRAKGEEEEAGKKVFRDLTSFHPSSSFLAHVRDVAHRAVYTSLCSTPQSYPLHALLSHPHLAPAPSALASASLTDPRHHHPHPTHSLSAHASAAQQQALCGVAGSVTGGVVGVSAAMASLSALSSAVAALTPSLAPTNTNTNISPSTNTTTTTTTGGSAATLTLTAADVADVAAGMSGAVQREACVLMWRVVTVLEQWMQRYGVQEGYSEAHDATLPIAATDPAMDTATATATTVSTATASNGALLSSSALHTVERRVVVLWQLLTRVYALLYKAQSHAVHMVIAATVNAGAGVETTTNGNINDTVTSGASKVDTTTGSDTTADFSTAPLSSATVVSALEALHAALSTIAATPAPSLSHTHTHAPSPQHLYPHLAHALASSVTHLDLPVDARHFSSIYRFLMHDLEQALTKPMQWSNMARFFLIHILGKEQVDALLGPEYPALLHIDPKFPITVSEFEIPEKTLHELFPSANSEEYSAFLKQYHSLNTVSSLIVHAEQHQWNLICPPYIPSSILPQSACPSSVPFLSSAFPSASPSACGPVVTPSLPSTYRPNNNNNTIVGDATFGASVQAQNTPLQQIYTVKSLYRRQSLYTAQVSDISLQELLTYTSPYLVCASAILLDAAIIKEYIWKGKGLPHPHHLIQIPETPPPSLGIYSGNTLIPKYPQFSQEIGLNSGFSIPHCSVSSSIPSMPPIVFQCHCRLYHDDSGPRIQCTQCHSFYHLACLGLTRTEVNKHEEFVCIQCCGVTDSEDKPLYHHTNTNTVHGIATHRTLSSSLAALPAPASPFSPLQPHTPLPAPSSNTITNADVLGYKRPCPYPYLLPLLSRARKATLPSLHHLLALCSVFDSARVTLHGVATYLSPLHNDVSILEVMCRGNGSDDNNSSGSSNGTNHENNTVAQTTTTSTLTVTPTATRSLPLSSEFVALRAMLRTALFWDMSSRAAITTPLSSARPVPVVVDGDAASTSTPTITPLTSTSTSAAASAATHAGAYTPSSSSSSPPPSSTLLTAPPFPISLPPLQSEPSHTHLLTSLTSQRMRLALTVRAMHAMQGNPLYDVLTYSDFQAVEWGLPGLEGIYNSELEKSVENSGIKQESRSIDSIKVEYTSLGMITGAPAGMEVDVEAGAGAEVDGVVKVEAGAHALAEGAGGEGAREQSGDVFDPIAAPSTTSSSTASSASSAVPASLTILLPCPALTAAGMAHRVHDVMQDLPALARHIRATAKGTANVRRDVCGAPYEAGVSEAQVASGSGGDAEMNASGPSSSASTSPGMAASSFPSTLLLPLLQRHMHRRARARALLRLHVQSAHVHVHVAAAVPHTTPTHAQTHSHTRTGSAAISPSTSTSASTHATPTITVGECLAAHLAMEAAERLLLCVCSRDYYRHIVREMVVREVEKEDGGRTEKQENVGVQGNDNRDREKEETSRDFFTLPPSTATSTPSSFFAPSAAAPCSRTHTRPRHLHPIYPAPWLSWEQITSINTTLRSAAHATHAAVLQLLDNEVRNAASIEHRNAITNIGTGMGADATSNSTALSTSTGANTAMNTGTGETKRSRRGMRGNATRGRSVSYDGRHGGVGAGENSGVGNSGGGVDVGVGVQGVDDASTLTVNTVTNANTQTATYSDMTTSPTAPTTSASAPTTTHTTSTSTSTPTSVSVSSYIPADPLMAAAARYVQRNDSRNATIYSQSSAYAAKYGLAADVMEDLVQLSSIVGIISEKIQTWLSRVNTALSEPTLLSHLLTLLHQHQTEFPFLLSPSLLSLYTRILLVLQYTPIEHIALSHPHTLPLPALLLLAAHRARTCCATVSVYTVALERGMAATEHWLQRLRNLVSVGAGGEAFATLYKDAMTATIGTGAGPDAGLGMGESDEQSGGVEGRTQQVSSTSSSSSSSFLRLHRPLPVPHFALCLCLSLAHNTCLCHRQAARQECEMAPAIDQDLMLKFLMPHIATLDNRNGTTNRDMYMNSPQVSEEYTFSRNLPPLLLTPGVMSVNHIPVMLCTRCGDRYHAQCLQLPLPPHIHVSEDDPPANSIDGKTPYECPRCCSQLATKYQGGFIQGYHDLPQVQPSPIERLPYSKCLAQVLGGLTYCLFVLQGQGTNTRKRKSDPNYDARSKSGSL